MVTDSHNILAMWRKHFSQLLNVQRFNHTAQPIMPEPNVFEVEKGIEKLKRHKSPGTDQVPAELVKAGDRSNGCDIHKIIIPILNKVELPEMLRDSKIVPTQCGPNVPGLRQ